MSEDINKQIVLELWSKQVKIYEKMLEKPDLPPAYRQGLEEVRKGVIHIIESLDEK